MKRLPIFHSAEPEAADPSTPIYGQLLADLPDAAALLHPFRFAWKADDLYFRDFPYRVDERLALEVTWSKRLISTWNGP